MQQSVQTDATCNIQRCWELLVNNVASVCTQPKLVSVMFNNICNMKIEKRKPLEI